MSPISDGRAVPQADRLTEPRARCPTDASVRGSSSQALARDDDQERREKLLLLGKGAVLAHRLAHPLAAESYDNQQS